MKFTTALVLSAVATLASAQSSYVTATSTFSATPAQTSEAGCLAKCDPTDNNCRSACKVGPAVNPNNAAANATTDCAGNCKQGNGSDADNNAYAQCLAACINSHYTFPGASATGAVLGSASSAVSGATASASSAVNSASASASSAVSSASGSASSAASSASSSASSGTATGSAAAATSSKPSSAYKLGASIAGAVGMFAVILAL